MDSKPPKWTMDLHLSLHWSRCAGARTLQAGQQIGTTQPVSLKRLEEYNENGRKVLNLVRTAGTPCEYHVLPGIAHHSVSSREGFREASRLALEWFTKHLQKP